MSEVPVSVTRRLCRAAVGLLIIAATSCAGTDNTSVDDVPSGFMLVETGPLLHVLPVDAGVAPDVSEPWTRHLWAHTSHPDVAAGELLIATDLPADASIDVAALSVSDEFPLDTLASQEAVRMWGIPGADSVFRIDYEQDFQRPEFDRLHITDLGIRTEDGEMIAVRVSAVTEMVEDGTFDTIIDSLEVDQ